MSLTEDQAASAEAEQEGVSPADTPAADSGEEKSFTDAVLSALDKPEESPASTDEPGAEAAEAGDTPPETSTQDDSETEEPDDKSALSEEEMSQLNSKTRARIDDLLSQRRGLSEDLRTAKAEIDTMKPAVENYGKIQSFLRDNDLSPADAGQALNLAGLIRNDPMEAFRQLQPIYAQLAQMAGAVLPNDLAEDVRLGRITQERALELSRARATTQVGQQRDQRNAQREQQRTEREAEQQRIDDQHRHASEIARIGDKLSAEKAQTDPDWKLKEPLVADALAADVVQNGFPKDEADLRARFKKAYDRISSHVSSIQPRPRPINGQPQSTSSPGQQAPAPKTMQEAVLRALD